MVTRNVQRERDILSIKEFSDLSDRVRKEFMLALGGEGIHPDVLSEYGRPDPDSAYAQHLADLAGYAAINAELKRRGVGPMYDEGTI